MRQKQRQKQRQRQRQRLSRLPQNKTQKLQTIPILCFCLTPCLPQRPYHTFFHYVSYSYWLIQIQRTLLTPPNSKPPSHLAHLAYHTKTTSYNGPNTSYFSLREPKYPNHQSKKGLEVQPVLLIIVTISPAQVSKPKNEAHASCRLPLYKIKPCF